MQTRGEEGQNFLVRIGGGTADDSSFQEEKQEGTLAVCILLLQRRVHYLPVITTVFIIASIFIAYGVSVSHGHVQPDFPYISHTAIKAPERCIFAQLVNMGAFLLGANVYVRYLQQSEQCRARASQCRQGGQVDRDRRHSLVSLLVGLLSTFGLTMVANFQVQTAEMKIPHYIGAGMALLLGLVYCWLQTCMSMRCQPRDCATIAQIANTIVLTVCFTVFAVSKSIFRIQESRGLGTSQDVLRPVYLLSTVSEWLTAVAVVTFVLTFYPSFSTITLHGPRVILPPETSYVTGNGGLHHSTKSYDGTSPV